MPKKPGGLSKAQEVSVTGQCNETGWYRISYNGGTGYVSSDYLVHDKPVEEAPAPSQPTEPAECPYPLYQPVDNWTSISWYYINSDPNALQYQIQADSTMMTRYDVEYGQLMYDDEWTGYFIDGCEVVKMTVSLK